VARGPRRVAVGARFVLGGFGETDTLPPGSPWAARGCVLGRARIHRIRALPDWLGVYTAGDSADNPNNSTCSAGYCGNGHYLLYEYTHNTIEGTTTFGPASQIGYTSWPLKTGNYEIRLLLDDGYRSVAASPQFKIVQP
jgi:hypothetical protein